MNLIPADSPNLEATLTHIRNESVSDSNHSVHVVHVFCSFIVDME